MRRRKQNKVKVRYWDGCIVTVENVENAPPLCPHRCKVHYIQKGGQVLRGDEKPLRKNFVATRNTKRSQA